MDRSTVVPLRRGAENSALVSSDGTSFIGSESPTSGTGNSSGTICQNSKEGKRRISDAQWFVELTYRFSTKEIARDCSTEDETCNPGVVEGWRRGTSEPKLSRFIPFFQKHPELVPALMERLGCVLIFNPKAMAAAEQFARAIADEQ